MTTLDLRSPPDSDTHAPALRPDRSRLVFGAAALSGWLTLWLITKFWGESLLRQHEMKLAAPPLTAFWDRRLNTSLLLMLAVAALVVWVLPAAVERARWFVVPIAAATATFAVSCAFAASDGWRGFDRVIGARTGYLRTAREISSPRAFLTDFVELIRTDQLVGVHVRGHPPGATLASWVLVRLGIDTPRGQAWFSVVCGAVAVTLVVCTVRVVVSEATARRSAPFIAASPMCLWIAVSFDAVFMACTALTVFMFSIAVTRPHRRTRLAFTVAAGFGYFVCVMLSYGYALLIVPLAALAVARKRPSTLVVVIAVASVLLIGVRALGFSYFEGLESTRAAYFEGVARNRPYAYFLVANIAALGIAIGPIGVLSLGWLRDRAAWVWCGGFLGALFLADISGMSKGEVERIWMPFALGLLAAGAAVWSGRNPLRSARIALAVQLLFMTWLQVSLRSLW